MTEMKHTPGPWEVGEYGSTVVTAYTPDRGRVSGCGCDNNFVSDLNDGDYYIYESEEGQRANAYLIAAAPEMLEALEKVKKYIERCMDVGYLAGTPEFVEEAIKKARGGEINDVESV